MIEQPPTRRLQPIAWCYFPEGSQRRENRKDRNAKEIARVRRLAKTARNIMLNTLDQLYLDRLDGIFRRYGISDRVGNDVMQEIIAALFPEEFGLDGLRGIMPENGPPRCGANAIAAYLALRDAE